MSAPPQVRAPKEDRAVVARPPLGEAKRLVDENRGLRAGTAPRLFGRPRPDLVPAARAAMLEAARAYLRQLDAVAPQSERPPLTLMAGHQPELFHPGVWVKNFALHGLARQLGATPVNLVVDNDTVKATSLHFPAVRQPLPPPDESPPYRAAEPFDHPATGEPYEECAVRDEALFASLPERVRSGWGYTPLLAEFWAEALRVGRRTPLLGDRFAAARRALERRWGCDNLEVPVSAVCQTEPFAWFACDLLTNLPRLHAAYNDSVHNYRERYGLRSTSHPVPDLAAEDDWLEAPFWAWRSGQTRRHRLMVRLTPEAVELRADDERWPSLPRQPEAMVQAFRDLGAQGFKVRSRALTNTMYARLFLCDLFVHGIGGGKYDEVTDAIIRRYYGAEPPAYLVLSATLLLPLPHYPDTPDDCRRLRREARDLYYNPQRHIDDRDRSNSEVVALVERKRSLIAEKPEDRRGRRERYRQIREVSGQLRSAAGAGRASVWRRAAECDAEVRANAILKRRDYPFVLYPESALRPFCEQFLTPDASSKLR